MMSEKKPTLMQKIKLIISVIVLIFTFMITSCSQKSKRVINYPETDLAAQFLIPKPSEVIAAKSGFALDEFTSIVTTGNDEAYQKVGEFLADKIKFKTGLYLSVNEETETTETVISINQVEGLDRVNSEAYEIIISNDSIVLNSSTAAGAFRGAQTIRQIIPEISNETLAENKIWVVPTGKIKDAPQFEYRGSMLDVARHFFSVEDVKKYIDVLSYYKYNVLHLHLSDDQGWRIEIKSWPKLTEIGGSTEVGGESGGFYTQEEYTEIVNYAAAHHITVVPEIDMPGHTNSASASYPWLNGNGKKAELYEGIEVGFSTFDTRNDSVYMFIDDVIREISELTPGPYFHIGGDESHVTKKDDYIYFVNKVEKIVQKYDKIMVGWDEVATADIDSTSISQWWASKENAELALEKNMKIILSPAHKAYLDMKYNENSKHGLSWAAIIPTDSAYIWTPEKLLPMESVIGIEAPLWSETISNIEELEYLAFPRAIGYSELGWTTEENRNWEDYKVRLANQAPYLERMNVKYYESPLIDWKKSTPTENVNVKELPKN